MTTQRARPVITSFTVSGQQQPRPGSLAGQTYQYEWSIDHAEEADAVILWGLQRRLQYTVPNGPTQTNFSRDQFAHHSGSFTMPAGVSLFDAESYTLALVVYGEGDLGICDRRDYVITAREPFVPQSDAVGRYLAAVADDLYRGLVMGNRSRYPDLTIRLEGDRIHRVDRPMVDLRLVAAQPVDHLSGICTYQAIVMFGLPDQQGSRTSAWVTSPRYLDDPHPDPGYLAGGDSREDWAESDYPIERQSITGADLAWQIMSRLQLHLPHAARNISLEATAVDPHSGFADYVIEWQTDILLDTEWGIVDERLPEVANRLTRKELLEDAS